MSTLRELLSRSAFNMDICSRARLKTTFGVYRLESVNLYKKDWSFFREAGRTVLWPHVEPEYKAELQGIADGLKAQGSTIDLVGPGCAECG